MDRAKDVIKSGGEWISSVELENAIMGHPQVLEAAVIARPAPEVAGAPARLRGAAAGRRQLTKEEILEHLRPQWRRGGSPTTWSSSTPCRRPASASSTRRSCGPALPTHVLPAVAAEPPSD